MAAVLNTCLAELNDSEFEDSDKGEGYLPWNDPDPTQNWSGFYDIHVDLETDVVFDSNDYDTEELHTTSEFDEEGELMQLPASWTEASTFMTMCMQVSLTMLWAYILTPC